MSNERLVGSIKPWQDRTPAPNDLPRTAQANPKRERGLATVSDGFQKQPSIDVMVVEEALRLDRNLGGADNQISRDQSHGLVPSVRNFVEGGKPLDGPLADVRAVQKQLNTLSDRVRSLCDAATAGIDALLPGAGEGSVSSDELLRKIWAGVNLVFPDIPKDHGVILVDVLVAANDAGRTGTETYLRAASDALRCEIQKCLISDAIMERFAGRVQGDPLSVKPSIVDRVFGALSAKTGILRTPEDAGNLGPAEWQALDELLEDAGKKEPETLPGLIAATAGQPDDTLLMELYPEVGIQAVLGDALEPFFNTEDEEEEQIRRAELTNGKNVFQDDKPWKDLTVGDLPQVQKAIELVSALPRLEPSETDDPDASPPLPPRPPVPPTPPKPPGFLKGALRPPDL